MSSILALHNSKCARGEAVRGLPLQFTEKRREKQRTGRPDCCQTVYERESECHALCNLHGFVLLQIRLKRARELGNGVRAGRGEGALLLVRKKGGK
jgi:hypothetical protein